MSQYLFVHSCGDKSMKGPKVYMALASKQVDGYSGSTRLHCDLCDAVNLMVYSSPPEGTALWHIFKVCDVNKIRIYIQDAFNHLQQDDPIHSQRYYLGPTKLEELKAMHGVVPFVIHQRVGEAVFIPAGCPHQVCAWSMAYIIPNFTPWSSSQVSNEANCIKVASDFLSIDALSACATLAGEFRNLNLQDTWREDVLQLNAQLYHAYVSLQRPFEDARSEFQAVQNCHTIRNDDLHLDPSEAVGITAESTKKQKRKHREDKEGERNPKRRFKCLHCNDGSRSFFKHGLENHLCVSFVYARAITHKLMIFTRQAKHMVDVCHEAFRMEQHLLKESD